MLRRTLVVVSVVQYCCRPAHWIPGHSPYRCRDCRHQEATETLHTNECLLGFLPLELYKELGRFVDHNSNWKAQYDMPDVWEQTVSTRERARCVLRVVQLLP
jgi:hypothetical protein